MILSAYLDMPFAWDQFVLHTTWHPYGGDATDPIRSPVEIADSKNRVNWFQGRPWKLIFLPQLDGQWSF